MTFDQGKSNNLYNTSVTALTPEIIERANRRLDALVPDETDRTTIRHALGIG